MLNYRNNEGVAFEWRPCEACGKRVATVETNCSACGANNPRWVPLAGDVDDPPPDGAFRLSSRANVSQC